jgi:hypothetical protein
MIGIMGRMVAAEEGGSDTPYRIRLSLEGRDGYGGSARVTSLAVVG